MKEEIRKRIEMIDRGEVPDGYKKTRLGIVPKEWNIKKLKDLASIKYGKSQKEVEDPNGKYKILGTGGEIGRTNKFLYDKESILIGRKGTLNKPMYINEPFWTVDTLFYTEISSDTNTRWLYYYISNLDLNRYNEATGVPSLSSANLNMINILTPSKQEQDNIVKIIYTLDNIIEFKENIIELNEKQRKGLVQLLLKKGIKNKEYKNSKVGYIPQNWKVKKIKEIASEISIRNKDNEYTKVLSCTKYDGLVDSLEYFKKRVYSDDISNYKIVVQRDFAYATNHIEEGSIGLQNICEVGLVSPMYTVFRTTKDVNEDYLFILLKTENYRRRFENMMSASVDRRGSLRWNDFSQIYIPLPPIEEQNEIVNIVHTADLEIKLLKEELEKIKEQKKGLMQLLLTGKVRVNELEI